MAADPAVLSGCLPDPVAAGSVRAKFVDCTDELPDGQLVSGRVGDIVLENARVKLIIRAFGEGYYFMRSSPGGIVDATHVGGEDLVKEILPIVELNRAAFDEIVITEAGDDGPAEVVVRGPIAPLPLLSAAVTTAAVPGILEQHYILEPDSNKLLIRSYLFQDASKQERTVTVGDGFLMGGKVDSWVPGKGNIEGTGRVELIATTGTTTSYGFAYRAEDVPALQYVDIVGVKLALGPTKSLGSPDPVERWLILGDGSPASVTSQAWAIRGIPTGTLEGTTGANLDVVVNDGDSPITRGRADANGKFSFDLPAGTYDVWSEQLGRVAGTKNSVTISAGAKQMVDLDSGAAGTLSLTVEDAGGTRVPARVQLIGDNTRIEYADASGELNAQLAPGDYTIVVSRGIEYDAYTATGVTISDGQSTPLAAVLDRVVDTSGWIAVDTHLHSEMSLDSQVTLNDRLRAIAAEGVEVAISTDHDFVTDYSSVVDHLGLGAFVHAQVGVEMSTIAWGHVNTWPLQPDYDKAGGHAIDWYDSPPSDVFQQMRDRGVGVIQINHPYSSTSGFFKTIELNGATLTAGLDPAVLGFPDADLSILNFDAVEVANSFDREGFDATLATWLAMVQAGHPAAATGSSDSHGAGRYPGLSRTYVYVGPGNDDPATVDMDALNAAIRARKVTVSQGAFVTASIVDPTSGNPSAVGAMTNLSGQTDATLAIKVQAPPWMPLAKIVIYNGTQLADEIILDDQDTAAVRYDAQVAVPISATGDSFFVVLVRPAGAGAPVLGTPDGSFTNPLMYDADGDGSWTAN